MMTREGMMKTGRKRIHRCAISAGASWVLILFLAGALPGFAQTAEGEPQDLKFEIINATTGEGASVDRLKIDYVTARRNNLVDFKPDGSTFTAWSVPIKDAGKYIITARYQGVPYWWSKRGRELTAGPVVLNVFDAVPNLEGVSVTGLNLVIRRQESLVRLEYMLQIDNLATPQVTVLDLPATFELALPEGVTGIKANYMRGPDPTPFDVKSPGVRSGLALPLTPGQNVVNLRAIVPWSEGMEIPVGSNLPMSAWSVLASPEWLEVGSTDMEENDSEKVSGFRRFTGFPLEADQTIKLRLNAGTQVAGPEEDLFTKPSPAENKDDGPAAEDEKSGGIPLPLIFVGVLIILILLAALRRRS
jgi:hypothetical protein